MDKRELTNKFLSARRKHAEIQRKIEQLKEIREKLPKFCHDLKEIPKIFKQKLIVCKVHCDKLTNKTTETTINLK